MEKNEYQREAYELLNKILSPKTQDFWITYHADDEELKTTFRMCMVNGMKYVKASTIHYQFLQMFKTMRNKGYLNENNIRYFLDKGRVSAFVELRPLILFKQKITALFDSGCQMDYKVSPVIDEANYAAVVDKYFSVHELKESQKAYNWRIELLGKSEEVKEVQNQEREREREINKEARLKDLVREIEDMGWRVTLTLKNG